MIGCTIIEIMLEVIGNIVPVNGNVLIPIGSGMLMKEAYKYQTIGSTLLINKLIHNKH